MNALLSRRREQRVLLLGFVLLTYATRLHRLTAQSLWRDEVDAIYFSLRHLPDTLAMFVQAGQNGALFFLTLRPWFKLVGSSEFALRYPSAWFGVLAVPLLWQVARLLIPSAASPAKTIDADAAGAESRVATPAQRLAAGWSALLSNAPLAAVLFLIANPYLLWYGQEGKMYALATALALLATWLWLRGLRGPATAGHWRVWLGYLVTVSIAIYSHLLMIMLIPLHMIWFLLAWPQSRRHWRGYGLALAGLTLPYVPLLLWQWALLFDSQKRTGFNFTPPVEMLQKVILDYTRGFSAPEDLLWLAPFFFLALAGLLMGFLEVRPADDDGLPALSPLRRHLLLLSWLLVPLALIYLLSLRQPIFTPRYVIWIAPAALMFMALGLQLLWRNGGRLAMPLATGLLVYTLGFWGYVGWQQQHAPIKYDLRSAVTTIAQQRTPDDLLILQIPHMEFAYRYYSSDLGPDPFAESDARLGRWMPGLWTNNGWPDEQARADVDQQMRANTQGVAEIWIMRSEVEMWDSRYLMDEWLQANGELLDEANFHGTQVRHYRLQSDP